MKTLFTLLIAFYFATGWGQNICTLNSKIKLVKQKPCSPCSEIYATTNKAGQFAYQWSKNNQIINGETNETIQVCDTTIQTYSVTVTDTSGCFDVDSLQVSNAKKCVDICHRRGNGRKTVWNNLCISPSAWAAHDAHGDSLGCCGSNQPTRVIHVHTNNGNHNGHRKMTVEFASFEAEKTVITLTGLDGKQLTVYEGFTDGQTLDVKVPSGVYILSMQTSGERITTKVVMLE